MKLGRVRTGGIVRRPGRAREMKLYVGAWSGGDGGVFVASAKANIAPYQLPCGIEAGDSRGVAFAILVDHLKDLNAHDIRKVMGANMLDLFKVGAAASA